MAKKRRAAIIGIATYDPESGLRNLQGAQKDAEEIKDKLNEYGEFGVEENFLTNRQATCENIRRTIDNLFFKQSDDELALFYFSGHGVMDGYGNRYLAPYDMNIKEPFVRGISLEELTKAVMNSKIRQSIMILDSCYSGQATKSDKDSDIHKDLKKITDPISKEKSTGQCKAVFASTAGNMQAREKLDCKHALGNEDPHAHGVYTFALIEGLNGGARDSRGCIMLDKLIAYIDNEFARGQFRELRQKPFRRISEGFNLADIFIAKDPEEFDRQIDNMITIAENFNLQDPPCLCSAVELVYQILLRDPENAKAQNMKTEIDGHIVGFFKDKVDAVMRYERQIKDITTATYKREFSEKFTRIWAYLETDCINLCVDKIYEMEKTRRDMLTNLLKLAVSPQVITDETILLFAHQCRRDCMLNSTPKMYPQSIDPRKRMK
jgi:hypothetical protein